MGNLHPSREPHRVVQLAVVNDWHSTAIQETPEAMAKTSAKWALHNNKKVGELRVGRR